MVTDGIRMKVYSDEWCEFHFHAYFMFLFCVEYKYIFTDYACNNVVLKLLLSIFNLNGVWNNI